MWLRAERCTVRPGSIWSSSPLTKNLSSQACVICWILAHTPGFQIVKDARLSTWIDQPSWCHSETEGQVAKSQEHHQFPKLHIDMSQATRANKHRPHPSNEWSNWHVRSHPAYGSLINGTIPSRLATGCEVLKRRWNGSEKKWAPMWRRSLDLGGILACNQATLLLTFLQRQVWDIPCGIWSKSTGLSECALHSHLLSHKALRNVVLVTSVEGV